MEEKAPEVIWKPIQSELLSQKVIEIVKVVANRLADPGEVWRIENTTNNFKNDNLLSLAVGYPGISLLYGELAGHFPDEPWLQAADRYFSKMEEAVLAAGLDDLSLFCGAAGIGTALYLSFQNNADAYEKYNKLRCLVDEFLLKTLPKEISFCMAKLGDVQVQDYDVIYGLSGIGRYALFLKDDPKMQSLLERILNYLVNLVADIETEMDTVPGWHISERNIFNKRESDNYPKGYFDCGLAHGVVGPLALLSISLLRGIEVKGQRAAIQKIAAWLEVWKKEAGMYWPCLLRYEEYTRARDNGALGESVTRDAWCYGSPGVGRVLWLAGEALNDLSLKNLAINTFDAVFARPEETWKAISPTFCHGFAGVMHLVNLMYQDTGLDRFAAYRERIIDRIMAYFKTEAPFGFYDYDIARDDIFTINKAGLLEGAAGIALTLLATVKPVKTNWDAVFLVK